MRKRKLAIISLTILLVCAFFIGATSPKMQSMRAYAQSNTSTDFATSDVMDNLYASTIDGVPFALTDFPAKANEPVKLLNFVEYAYGYDPNNMANFGLFVYFYNPSLVDIQVNSTANTIQMATVYDNENKPVFYKKFQLKFISKSTGNVANLFYKFKIDLNETERAQMLKRLNTHQRRYDVSGAELRLPLVTRDYKIGRSIVFKGFAKGYGLLPEMPSTLECSVNESETISLNVQHTWYRTEASTKNQHTYAGWQQQINTVYFSVPNRILEEYGKLQKILAEWWEFQTQPIYVTKHNDLYNKFSPYVGQYVDKNKDMKYGIYKGIKGGGSDVLNAGWGYNDIAGLMYANRGQIPEKYMNYLFKVNDIEKYSASELPKGGISSEVLSDYIMNYDKSFRNGYLPINERQISADLFTDTIDSDRIANGIQRGYNLIEVDADETQSLTFYDGIHQNSFWEWFWSGGVPYTLGSELERTLIPIEALPAVFPTGSDSQLAEQLFVNVADISKLRSFHTAATVNDETVFLFRFAVTDYKCDWLTLYDDKNTAWFEILTLGLVQERRQFEGEIYRAQQTVFLDFDIIQLTFNGERGYYAIPVVSDPTDIIADITPPSVDPPQQWQLPAWLTLLLALIVGVLLLLILAPFLPTIFSVLMWLIKALFTLITLPFRILKQIIEDNKKRKKRGENDEKKDKKHT